MYKYKTFGDILDVLSNSYCDTLFAYAMIEQNNSKGIGIPKIVPYALEQNKAINNQKVECKGDNGVV